MRHRRRGAQARRLTRRHELHASLNDVLERALYPNPKDRFGSAEEMAHALEAFIAVTGESLTHTHVADWLEGLFGKDAANQNVAVAPRQMPMGQGTDVLSAPFVIPSGEEALAVGSDMVASAPTMIERRLQGGQRDTDPPAAVVMPEPARVAARRWPFLAGAAALLVIGAAAAWNPGPHGRAAGGGDVGAQPHQGEAREARGAPARRRAPGGGSGVRHG
ncbi:MAG: hypothetical protein IPJ65_23095 [Archangiaceae bacterium]|nr:hypothetical protein [Archangiaceae bacterium]